MASAVINGKSLVEGECYEQSSPIKQYVGKYEGFDEGFSGYFNTTQIDIAPSYKFINEESQRISVQASTNPKFIKVECKSAPNYKIIKQPVYFNGLEIGKCYKLGKVYLGKLTAKEEPRNIGLYEIPGKLTFDKNGSEKTFSVNYYDKYTEVECPTNGGKHKRKIHKRKTHRRKIHRRKTHKRRN